MNNNSESEVGSVGAVYCPKGDTAKRCNKCNVVKTIDEYNIHYKKKNGDIKYRNDCKACRKQYQVQYRDKNKEKLSVKDKQRYQENKQIILVRNKQYYEENKEQILIQRKLWCENNKEHLSEYQKRYREEHKGRLNEQQKQYLKNRYSADLEFKLKGNIRGRIYKALRSQLNNGQKSACTQELLGISMDKYIRWIEFQLKDGWTWDNWGSDFHIDHVYPLAKHDLSKKEEHSPDM